MKIKERLSSIRELNNQFERVRNNERQRPKRELRRAEEDAVRVDSRLAERSREAERPDRRERVEQLRTEVRERRYRPDSREVAKALLRDLI